MTEEDMRDISYPALELGIHIAYKNVEAGSLIGGFVVAPLWHGFQKRGVLDKLKLHNRIGICGGRGMLIGKNFALPCSWGWTDSFMMG